jgi:hypothetical protein
LKKTCEHAEFKTTHTTEYVHMQVGGNDRWQLVLKVSMHCASCGEPFKFKAHAGLSPTEASTEGDRSVLTIPIERPNETLIDRSTEAMLSGSLPALVKYVSGFIN